MERPKDNGEIKTEACRAYARMMNNLDYSGFEPWLTEDFHYASQWVCEEITSKAAFAAYIVPKLQTIKNSGNRVWAEIAYAETLGAGPCVVLAQGDPDDLEATLLISMRDEMISRADLCCIPRPEDCGRTGEIPT